MDWDSFFTFQNWGAVPDWAGAIGTIGAVILALASASSSKKQLREERRNAADERKEAAHERALLREQYARELATYRRRTAGRVTLTITESPAEASGLQFRYRYTWTLRNQAELPIYQVVLVERDLSPNGSNELKKHWAVIEGGGTRTFEYEGPFGGFKEAQFTDGDGVRWLLPEGGVPVELSSEDHLAKIWPWG